MLKKLKGWAIWATVSGLMLVSGAYALLNFIAAASLGYDVSVRGTSILTFWGYAALGLFGATVASAIVALSEWRRTQREVQGPKA